MLCLFCTYRTRLAFNTISFYLCNKTLGCPLLWIEQWDSESLNDNLKFHHSQVHWSGLNTVLLTLGLLLCLSLIPQWFVSLKYLQPHGIIWNKLFRRQGTWCMQCNRIFADFGFFCFVCIPGYGYRSGENGNKKPNPGHVL